MPGLLSLASSLSGGTLLSSTAKRKQAAIIVDLQSDGSVSGDFTQFQYFPETITDTKAVNWVAREIPGGSLPVYQWVSSGERAIAFTAVFTSDIDIYDPKAVGAWQDLKSLGIGDRNVDIRAALVWLRRYMLPTYGPTGAVGVPEVQAPAFAQLILPGSSIGLTGGESAMTTHDQGQDQITCLMSQCDITYVQSFPSGAPRIAEVALTFLQVPQFAGSGVIFPQFGGPDGSMTIAMNGSGKQYFGYNLVSARAPQAVGIPGT